MQCDKNDHRSILAGLEGVSGEQAVDSETMTAKSKSIIRRPSPRFEGKGMASAMLQSHKFDSVPAGTKSSQLVAQNLGKVPSAVP
jgi:hypothetical protein